MIDRGERVAAMFLDFYKAFDRVWHDGLLHKLGECGLHPSSLAWLINYLSDRSLSVRVCNTVHSEIFSQILFDFKRMVSHSISPKFSGNIPYVLSKPRICFVGSKEKTVLC